MGGGAKLLLNPRTDKVERERALVQLNNQLPTNQSSRVYSYNGLSITVNAAGNNGWYVVSDEDEQEIKEHCKKVLPKDK